MGRVVSRVAIAVVAALLFGPPQRPLGPAPGSAFEGVGTVADAALLGDNGSILSVMAGQALTAEALDSLDPRLVSQDYTFVSLAVLCALTEEDSLDVTIRGSAISLPGQYRMAPEWKDGPCDQTCQEYVSSCMLAKINGYGVPVRLFFNTRGDHPARQGADPPWDFGYTVEEGAFFGNIFAPTPRLYACRGRGRDPLLDTFRVCTHPGSACHFESIGPCLAVEGGTEPHACESIDDRGVFRNCHDRLSLPGTNEFPEDAVTYDHTLSSYLIPSVFAAGLEAETCFEGSSLDTFAPREPTSTVAAIGDPCATDDDCNDPELVCDLLMGGGVCTKSCENSDDVAAEAADCGDEDAVCQKGYSNDFTRCLHACRADVAGGRGCQAGQVCSAYHLYQEDFGAEATACLPFCQTDDDCPGTFCDDRLGSCTLEPPGSDDALLEDGMPCQADSPTNQCQGTCVPSTYPDGTCGSYINLAETRTCPEDPDVGALLYEDDDLGLCFHRLCGDDTDCPPPLVCVNAFGAGLCDYP